MSWLHRRREILSRTNRDNALLESGSVRVAGNENIRAGTFIELGTGALAAPYYVHTVSHDYHAFRGLFTTLHVERGHGFARRIHAAGSVAPYLLDLGARPTSTPAPTAPLAIGQTGQPGTPDAGNTPATERTPAPSTETTGGG